MGCRWEKGNTFAELGDWLNLGLRKRETLKGVTGWVVVRALSKGTQGGGLWRMRAMS